MGEVKGHETYHSLVLGIGATERWTMADWFPGWLHWAVHG